MRKFSDHLQRREDLTGTGGGGGSQPNKTQVFDDFRAFKLCAIKALNNATFQLEKSFIPLVVCKNIPSLIHFMNVHNGKYPVIKDLSFINKCLETNGGFNFSLLSFDVSQFILAPGFYMQNNLVAPSGPYLSNQYTDQLLYNLDAYNPFAPPVIPPRGQTLPPPEYLEITPIKIDCGAILIYLEV